MTTLQHLDDLDRLLRDVQAGLVPEAAIPDPPPPPPIPDPPPPPPVPDPLPPPPAPEPPALAELTARLLAAMRELLDGYERVLVGEAPLRPAAGAARRRGDSPVLTVSAAPFPDLEAVRRFEAAIERLPGVREVAVRGYEGSDRAVLEVRIDPPSP